MGKVLQFQREVSTMKVLSDILYQIFIEPFEDINQKSKQKLKKKILFLEQEAYKELFYQLLDFHKNRIGNSVDIAAWKYADTDARFYAKKYVSIVIANNRVDKCYKARIKELKEKEISSFFDWTPSKV